MKLSLIGIRWSVCGGRGVREGGRDGWRCCDGRGEAVGEGEIQTQGNPRVITPPLNFLIPLLLFLPPNNEGQCMDGVSKVSAVASGP